MNTVFFILLLIFAAYLAFNTLYLFVLAVAGNVGHADDVLPAQTPQSFKKMIVLIPAYKEDAVILESVETNLRQTYPKEHFDLLVIADSFKPQTIAKLEQMPIKVLQVSFEFSTVTKAINAALASLPDNVYDVVVVSDADNHMAPDFLSRVNAAFEQGWKAVQGHRVAKNLNTRVALLDGISEEINNHMFRKGYRSLNLTSSIIGSGMAIDFRLMKTAMGDMATVGGFDKELEMKLAIDGHRVGFLEDAYIYDEKVSKAAVFESQRTRWIAAQWQFLCYYFKQGVSDLFSGRMLSASKTLQALVLPKVLLLGLLALCFVVGLLTGVQAFWLVPGVLLLTLCIGLFISIPSYLLKRLSVRDLFLVVTLMFSFVRAVFNIRKAYKTFIHTPHSN